MLADRVLPLACALGLLACAEAEDSISSGRFQVEAARTKSCGDVGLLASPAEQSYVVTLRRVSSKMLQWDDGKNLLSCLLEADGLTFAEQSSMSVDMRADEEPSDKPPCVVRRADLLSGVLQGTSATSATGFEATMSYEFVPTEGSSCDDLLTGAEPIADTLPCTLEYELTATRMSS
jgi:hypothetical protein